MKLIDNPLALWKSYTVLLAAAGATVPGALQLIADNTDLLPWLDDGYKSGIRLACLLLIPVVRAIKQPALAQPAPQEAP